MRPYWKVVRKVNGEYLSLFPEQSAETLYSQTGVTYPNPRCGPLTVLKTLKAAKHLKAFGFFDFPGNIKIIKLEAKLSGLNRVWKPRPNNPFEAPLSVVQLKRLEEGNSRILLPGHTKLAEWVKFIAEVK